ncbi:MAG: hypothetical protein JSS40_00040 [Proteobacteria bacterium]|nr:hypothetical protein [Pseudomonadota bacterium]
MNLRVVAFVVLLSCLFPGDLLRAADTPGEFPFKSDAGPARVLKDLKDAVSAGNKNLVADLASFPIRVQLDGKGARIGRRTFLARYDEVLTPAVKSALLRASFESRDKYDGVWWNWQGMMVGAGEIWIAEVQGGAVRVITINNQK